MNYKNKIKIIISIFFISFLIFNFNFVNAAEPNTDPPESLKYDPLKNLETVAVTHAHYTSANEDTLLTNVATIVAGILSLLGIIFLVLILMGGYQWMMAGGNEETITKAKKRITNATIGLAIIALAYAIHIFVIKMLL